MKFSVPFSSTPLAPRSELAAAGNGLADNEDVLRSVLAGCVAMVVYMAGEEFFITAFWVTVLWTMFVVIGAETVKEEAPYSA